MLAMASAPSFVKVTPEILCLIPEDGISLDDSTAENLLPRVAKKRGDVTPKIPTVGHPED